jgi:hypothetical protein
LFHRFAIPEKLRELKAVAAMSLPYWTIASIVHSLQADALAPARLRQGRLEQLVLDAGILVQPTAVDYADTDIKPGLVRNYIAHECVILLQVRTLAAGKVSPTPPFSTSPGQCRDLTSIRLQ